MPQPRVIAVIDDDLFILDATQSLLSSYGYHAELYVSADEFLSLSSSSKAVCLIIDVQLAGGGSGFDLADQLAVVGVDLPIIFMTADDDPRVRQRALDKGCIAFLHKPFSASELIKALSKVGPVD
jgi:FixJ family two-component response regulator